ncbi:hypothetical protein ACIBKX_08230 [Streptomyces sp. NPDC050658]
MRPGNIRYAVIASECLAKSYVVAAFGVKFAKPPWNSVRPETGTAYRS